MGELHEHSRQPAGAHDARDVTSTAEVVEQQDVTRAEQARFAVGCLEFDLTLADHAELALRSGMEISEPVLGPAEEDDSGGGERIGDCDWRSGRRERGKFEFHVHVLEVRLSVDAVVDANIAQRLRSTGVPAHAPTIHPSRRGRHPGLVGALR